MFFVTAVLFMRAPGLSTISNRTSSRMCAWAGDHPVWRGSLRTLHPHRPFLHRAVPRGVHRHPGGPSGRSSHLHPRFLRSQGHGGHRGAGVPGLRGLRHRLPLRGGGVVLFVQLIPKLTHADLDRERDRLTQVSQNAARRTGRVCLDEFGLMPLALAIVCGIVVGSCKVGNFSLTTTGGCLLAGLVFGHFGRIGPVNLMPRDTTLKAMRELGLVLFLIGAGVRRRPGSRSFSTPSTLSMASS